MDPQSTLLELQPNFAGASNWIITQAVQTGVNEAMADAAGAASGARPTIALVGHEKDPTSIYLQHFEGWALLAEQRFGSVDAAHLRDAWFGGAAPTLDAAFAALCSAAPQSTLDFMRAWSRLPYFSKLAQEWRALQSYKNEWAPAPYPPVFVTVDALVTCANHVLLIRRAHAPGAGLLALPGGFIEQRETVYQSAVRELREETQLRLLESTMRDSLKPVVVFDHPDRSLRGRTITHAHHFDLGARELPEVRAADDARSASWVPIEQLCELEDQCHDDHFHMLDHFLDLTSGEASS
jgi:bifunctional NMN adenylyltransferase/nudix hydrolase